MSINSKMTAIADKIRSLLGLSGTMGLDAMATNLATANTHVADALAALVEKEVDTTGAGLPDLAALIAGLEVGGGVTVVQGSITYAENEHCPVIPVESAKSEDGFLPDFFLWYQAENPLGTILSTSDISYSVKGAAIGRFASRTAYPAASYGFMSCELWTFNFHKNGKFNAPIKSTTVQVRPEGIFPTGGSPDSSIPVALAGSTYSYVCIWGIGGSDGSGDSGNTGGTPA